jgi:uncharacterized membrane protein YqjE
MKEGRLKFGSDTATVEDPPANGRPLVAIFRDMVSHVSEIVRAEILLVTLEFREEIAERKNAAISIAVANVLILYGGAFLLLGLVYALSTIWPSWLSAVAVGAVVSIIGCVVLATGIKKIKNPKST